MKDIALYAELSRMLEKDGPVFGVLRCMASTYITWDEFLAMRLPEELSPVDTWDLLKLLNRATGIDIPVPDLDGNKYWYVRTHEIEDSIAHIWCSCRTGSDLFNRLTATRNAPVLVRAQIDETIAGAQLDGLEISAADCEDLLQTGRAPRSDNERLVANTLSALDHLEELRDEPFSRELLEHLRDLVIKDVDTSRIVHVAGHRGIVKLHYDEAVTREHTEEQMAHICDYANHTSGDVHDHVVFRALLLPDLFRLYRLFPDVSSQVGRLAARLYAIKVSVPVLGMLSMSRAKLDWEANKLSSGLVTYGPEEYLQDRIRQRFDLTGYATLSVQLALVALLDLTWKLNQLEREDKELRTLLQRDPEINHRQRSILGRALRDPAAEFRIAYHKTTHNVVYATARADLLELVEKGFLEVGKKGRAMVFTPRPGLREFIENGYLASGAETRHTPARGTTVQE
ncbi:MAG: hypothetical protein ABFC80_03935 [Coriobacteriales bacterium]